MQCQLINYNRPYHYDKKRQDTYPVSCFLFPISGSNNIGQNYIE